MSPALRTPNRRLDVRLQLLPGEASPLKHWTPIHLHLGASHLTARIALLEGERLDPGGESFAQLILEGEIGARRGDRFVVRDQSAQRTLGGGVILDTAAPARGRRAPQRLALLAAIHSGEPARVLECLLNSSGNGVDLTRFAADWSLDDYAAATLLPMAVVPSPSGPWGFAQQEWDRLGEKCLATLAEEHVAAHHRRGIDRERLRRRVAPILSRPAFGARIDALLAEQRVVRSGSLLHLPDHQVALPEAEVELAQPDGAAACSSPPSIHGCAMWRV